AEASRCRCSVIRSSSPRAAGATLEQTSSVPTPSSAISSNLAFARRRLAASRSGATPSKSRNGWYSSIRRPRSAARSRICAGEDAELIRSLSKISTPSKPTCAAVVSFSSRVPLSDTVAIDLRIAATPGAGHEVPVHRLLVRRQPGEEPERLGGLRDHHPAPGGGTAAAGPGRAQQLG